ncbi:GLRB [Symbiodinium natans]|uniref:GLRB protein n=1 Tax=Symbiodinium natans TaxID=878477 RepID=A0A812R1P0_9DINO|nr:GLRB [Symbiodinium natans]
MAPMHLFLRCVSLGLAAFSVSLAQQLAAEACEEGYPAKTRELLQHVPLRRSISPVTPNVGSKALRPNEGGMPDVIHVGVLLKAFYGTNLHDEYWEGDIVLSFSWHDPRAAGLVPQDLRHRILSSDQATQLMWMPDIVITNVEIEGQQVVSTSIYVDDSGNVNKTQRVLVRIKEEFDGKEFPYDKQALTIQLASATYMDDAVQLVPCKDYSFTDAGPAQFAKSDWTYLWNDLTSFVEISGPLRKSRAQFVVHIVRDASPFLSGTIFPEIMIVVLGYTVFLFPVNPGFAMPRVSSAMIAFLSILTISTRTSAMLPEVRRGIVWMELFEIVCKMLLFTTVLLNILTERVFHTWQQPELAHRLVYELRVGFPVVAFASLASCWFATGQHLQLFAAVHRIALLAAVTLFIWSVVLRDRGNTMEK